MNPLIRGCIYGLCIEATILLALLTVLMLAGVHL